MATFLLLHHRGVLEVLEHAHLELPQHEARVVGLDPLSEVDVFGQGQPHLRQQLRVAGLTEPRSEDFILCLSLLYSWEVAELVPQSHTGLVFQLLKVLIKRKQRASPPQHEVGVVPRRTCFVAGQEEVGSLELWTIEPPIRSGLLDLEEDLLGAVVVGLESPEKLLVVVQVQDDVDEDVLLELSAVVDVDGRILEVLQVGSQELSERIGAESSKNFAQHLLAMVRNETVGPSLPVRLFAVLEPLLAPLLLDLLSAPSGYPELGACHTEVAGHHEGLAIREELVDRVGQLSSRALQIWWLGAMRKKQVDDVGDDRVKREVLISAAPNQFFLFVVDDGNICVQLNLFDELGSEPEDLRCSTFRIELGVVEGGGTTFPTFQLLANMIFQYFNNKFFSFTVVDVPDIEGRSISSVGLSL